MAVVDLDAARTHLGLEPDDLVGDSVVQGLILAAAGHIERNYGFAANRREAQYRFDRFGRMLTIPVYPVADDSAVTVSYIDPAGDEQPFTAFRRVDLDGWTRVMPICGAFPRTLCQAGVITVTCTVGFGDGGEDDPVFGPVRAAMLAWISALFDNSDTAVEPSIVPLLLDGMRRHRV